MKEFVFGRWQVTAAPECGGNLAQVKFENTDIMRGFTDISEWQQTPTNYGFAVLFPPNRIDGGKFTFNGKQYHLPVNEAERGNHLHGIALREEWLLDEVTDNSLSMSWVFDKNSPMYSGYPFDCKLSVTYTFTENLLLQKFTAENLSKEIIPCALGFHTAFAVPESLCVQGRGGRIELLPPRYLVSGREIDWLDGFEPNKWCSPKKIWPFGHFRMDPSARQADLDYGSFKLRYTVDEKFDHWMVWRPEFDTSFVCIEPMNIKIGTFENHPELLPVLSPGESMTFSSSVEIINKSANE